MASVSGCGSPHVEEYRTSFTTLFGWIYVSGAYLRSRFKGRRGFIDPNRVRLEKCSGGLKVRGGVNLGIMFYSLRTQFRSKVANLRQEARNEPCCVLRETSS